jgi:hypothetical protein
MKPDVHIPVSPCPARAGINMEKIASGVIAVPANLGHGNKVSLDF